MYLEEYQSMELIKNKRIGKILFIVEGSKHEFSLIKKIFEDLLGYKRIEKNEQKPPIMKVKPTAIVS